MRNANRIVCGVVVLSVFVFGCRKSNLKVKSEWPDQCLMRTYERLQYEQDYASRQLLGSYVHLLSFVARGGDADAKDSSGNTLLLLATRFDDFDVVRELTDARNFVDLNIADASKNTALMYAVKNQNMVVLERLIKNGAPLDAVDDRGRTALISAILLKNERIVKMLIDAGCRVDIKDADGRTAGDYAYKSCSLKMVEAIANAISKQKEGGIQ